MKSSDRWHKPKTNHGCGEASTRFAVVGCPHVTSGTAREIRSGSRDAPNLMRKPEAVEAADSPARSLFPGEAPDLQCEALDENHPDRAAYRQIVGLERQGSQACIPGPRRPRRQLQRALRLSPEDFRRRTQRRSPMRNRALASFVCCDRAARRRARRARSAASRDHYESLASASAPSPDTVTWARDRFYALVPP